MITFGSQFEHDGSGNGPNWLFFGARRESDFSDVALRGSLCDLDVELLAVVERKPLLLQALELLNIAHFVLPNPGLWQWVVLEVLLQLLVDFAVDGRRLVGREGRRLYGPHEIASTTITILFSSFVLFKCQLLIVYTVLPGIHGFNPLLLSAPAYGGEALAKVPAMTVPLLRLCLFDHQNQLFGFSRLRSFKLHWGFRSEHERLIFFRREKLGFIVRNGRKGGKITSKPDFGLLGVARLVYFLFLALALLLQLIDVVSHEIAASILQNG